MHLMFLSNTDSKDIGLNSSFSPGFGIGVCATVFQWYGTLPKFQLTLYILLAKLLATGPEFFTIEYVILSAPGALSLPLEKALSIS